MPDTILDKALVTMNQGHRWVLAFRKPSRSWTRSDIIAAVALAFAIISAGASFSIARNARLDAKRAAIRSQALSFINFYQKMLNNYDCYFIALPNATNIHKNNDSELRSGVEKAKDDLAKLDAWNDASLDYFRDTLNRLPGDSSGMNTNLVGQLRAKLDASQLARADEVCEFSD